MQDWIRKRGFKTLYIKPGSPWQNAYSESFNSRFRDEFLNREALATLLEAKVLGKGHRQHYDVTRPPLLARLSNPQRIREVQSGSCLR